MPKTPRHLSVRSAVRRCSFLLRKNIGADAGARNHDGHRRRIRRHFLAQINAS